jgi:hypothetical protein
MMSARSLALAAAAALALGSMTFAVSPVSAQGCDAIALADAAGAPNLPGIRVSLAVD